MRLRVGMFGFAFCMTLALARPACAGDDALDRPFSARAPIEIEHTTNLELARKSRKRTRSVGNVERSDFLDLDPGLRPFTWPRNGDVRSRILTSELRRTPVVGWIAENLYRSKRDNGWCLEVDPGEGEYVVFYRLNL